MIAGEMSAAYDDIVTLSLVSHNVLCCVLNLVRVGASHRFYRPVCAFPLGHSCPREIGI